MAVNGNEIRRLRDKLKLSQSEAASQIGWTAQRWSDFERGRYPDPRVSTLQEIANVLRCSIGKLVDTAPDTVKAVRAGRKRKQP